MIAAYTTQISKPVFFWYESKFCFKNPKKKRIPIFY